MDKVVYIASLRDASRKLVRELGMLQLNNAKAGRTPSHWHALIEVANEPGITISKLSNLLILSLPATSRIIDSLISSDLIFYKGSIDKREKRLFITHKGKNEVSNIDDFSNIRIKGALSYLSQEEQQLILMHIKKYSQVLEKSRLNKEEVKILKLSTSRLVRKKIISMIETIQKNEFNISINEEINSCILKAEEHFHYNNTCNFWYATNAEGAIIGSIGLKKIDNNSAEIKKFFVKQDYRSKGVAQKLFNKLVMTASKHSFKYLYLGTVNKLKAAQRFYEKKGFHAIDKKQLPLGFDVCSLDNLFFTCAIKAIKLNQEDL